MIGIRRVAVFGALLGASVACAAPALPAGHPPQPDFSRAPAKGQTWSAGFYTCPIAPSCAVKVTVTKPPTPGGKVCKVELTGDDNTKFFYIDRNEAIAEQTIVWTVVAADPGWTANFVERPPKKKGIDFTEGGEKENVDQPPPAGTPTKQERKIKANKNGGNRRSLLLYDIVVDLVKAGEPTIQCEPFGPGILNRG